MPTSFDSETLCLNLLNCHSEKEVELLIRNTPAMRDGIWKPLDQRETNFNVTSNQASDGGKALTELMTNMVDAVLLRYAHEKNIDPKSDSAPRTMYSAVETLISIKHLRGGRLVDADDESALRSFALDHLIIGVTGGIKKDEGLPCFTFIDNGEGQHPDHFENTFLSLSAGNKKDIPFVQGKYNMGSSGVLGYCGRLWYKLIISRRHDRSGEWGWTLVRRRPDDGMPVAEYFAHEHTIPRFDSERISPFNNKEGQSYGVGAFASGTIIKLYDYQLGKGFSSFKAPTEALNENLVESILPFRILDFRDIARKQEALIREEKKGPERALGIYPRPFYGMEYLLLRSHTEGVSDMDDSIPAGTKKFDVGETNDAELGLIKIHAVVLKPTLPDWLKPRRTNNRVFHSVNGQVQFKQTRGFLSTSCRLPALKDRVIIFVDASELTFRAHNDVWKGDRENIRQTIIGQRYLSIVTQLIQNSESLRELQEIIAQEELQRTADTNRDELFQKLVNKDRNFANFLNDINPQIKVPTNKTGPNGTDGPEKYSGEYSPTYVRFDRPKQGIIEIPIGTSRPIVAHTDAVNEYFIRSDNKGTYYFNNKANKSFTTTRQLNSGRLILFVTPIQEITSIGETFDMRLSLYDDSMPEPVSDSIIVKIVERIRQPKTKKPKKVKGTTKNVVFKHSLPKYTLLTKDGRDFRNQKTEIWQDDFNEYDGGLVYRLGDKDKTIYKINLDNIYHVKYLAQQTTEVSKNVIREKFIMGMLITMLGFEKALDKELKENQNLDDFSDDFRKLAASGAASVILTMVDILPKIVDPSSMQALSTVDE